MKIILMFSNLIIPMTIGIVILYGYGRKVDLYDSFVEGAKDGMSTVAGILPTIVGLMVAVGILRASGALDILGRLVAPLTNLLGYPKETVPLTLMRLVSSSASTGLLLDLFKQFGPDSYIGRFVSIMMSCTETVFYTMSVYFMSVKITKTRYTLAGALIANLAGVAASLAITNLLYAPA
ncbi:MAG: spore maturation protein [Clostridiales bacterium]|jgi:spore maturation protein B|nr:spore maturation protein [Clostridiales bacterium]